jgi:hypothetical protein
VTLRARSLGDAKSSLGDAKSSLVDAKSSLGDAESSLGDAKSSLGDAKSSLGDAKSSLGDVYTAGARGGELDELRSKRLAVLDSGTSRSAQVLTTPAAACAWRELGVIQAPAKLARLERGGGQGEGS